MRTLQEHAVHAQIVFIEPAVPCTAITMVLQSPSFSKLVRLMLDYQIVMASWAELYSLLIGVLPDWLIGAFFKFQIVSFSNYLLRRNHQKAEIG